MPLTFDNFIVGLHWKLSPISNIGKQAHECYCVPKITLGPLQGVGVGDGGAWCVCVCVCVCVGGGGGGFICGHGHRVKK